MGYWLVVHDAASYEKHPDWIGKLAPDIPKDFGRRKVGDGVVCYCRGESVIAGTFRLASASRQIADDPIWEGPYTVAEIEPVAALAPGGELTPVRELLRELPEPVSLFSDRQLRGITLRGRTLLPPTESDFTMATEYVKQWQPVEEGESLPPGPRKGPRLAPGRGSTSAQPLYTSIWPLPGGARRYARTLREVLRQIDAVRDALGIDGNARGARQQAPAGPPGMVPRAAPGFGGIAAGEAR